MAKLIDIIGKPISGEWGTDDLAGTGIPVLRTTNFTNEGVVDYRDVVTRQITKKNLSEKMLRHGDIILEKSGGSDKQPVGRVIFFEGEENKYLFNNFTGLLRVKDRAKWIPKYVFYALFANYIMGGTVRYENKTTGLHNLQTDAYVSAVDIPDCSIEKQEKIVSCLDEVIGLIGKQRQQLAKLDELVKSQFVEMFGERFSTNRIKVEEIADSTIGLTYKPENTSDTGTIVLRSGNIQNSELTLADDVVRVSGMKIPDSKYVHPGDILMCSRNGSANLVGKCCRIPEVCEEMAFGAFMTVIRSKYPAFLFGFFQSHYFKEQLTNVGTTSINQITTKMLNGYETIEPTKDEEKRFATLLAQIDKSKLAVQKTLEKLETLKKSLMQQYFG